jgi:predicted permease
MAAPVEPVDPDRDRRDDVARDVRDELAFHRDMRDADPASRARRGTADAASLTKLARSRDRRLAVLALVEEWRFDLIDVLRRLRRAPGFALGAIAILGVGLGAAASVFGLANTMYFRALPFADAESLTRVQETAPLPDGTTHWVDASTPTLMAAKASDAFVDAAGLSGGAASLLVTNGPARHIGVGRVGEGWSDVTGLRPLMGRLFTRDEERLGDAATVAVVSEHLWRTYLDRRADVIGHTLAFDGGVREIVGVMPAGYRFPYDQDAWWPGTFAPNGRSLYIFGRLRPGVSVERANAALRVTAPSLNAAWPDVLRGMVPQARTIRDVLVRDEDRMVLLLGWAVAALLLIVGSNVAMLLTTRIVGRQQELALRAALGCGWGRQLRHLTMEALVLFVLGGAAGLTLAAIGRTWLAAALPARLTAQLPLADLPIDWRVITFTLTLAVASGLLFGGFAAWRSMRGGRGVTSAASRAIGSRGARRTAGMLIGVELALASALVAGTVIVAGALRQVESRDVGFSTSHLLTLQLQLSGPRLGTPAGHVQALTRLEERLQALPELEAVGTTTVNPLCCGDWGSRATPEGRFVRLEDAPAVNWRLVSPSFFDAMGIRVLAGRAFDQHDTETSEPVVIVDERFARRFWPGQDAVGKRVKRGGTDSPTPWKRVVGVVSAVEDAGEYTETWYVPYLQQPAAGSTEELHVMMRVRDEATAAAAVRRAVAEVDPALAIVELRSMDAVKRAGLQQQQLGVSGAMVFAVVGGLLALCGVYALVTFVVAGESRDMAIRMALGASGAGVVRQVVARVGRLAAAGGAIGLTVALVTERQLVEALGARPQSFAVWSVTAAVLLVMAAAGAALLPARRVLRLDPRDVLNR